jgi:hypothetical protein
LEERKFYLHFDGKLLNNIDSRIEPKYIFQKKITSMEL